jgi:hypothetical protein
MMAQFTSQPSRTATIGVIAVGVAIAISSLSIVRAEITPDRSKTFSCSSGTACVEGNSTGSKTWGVYGVSGSADGVHGVTSTTNGNSAVAGISMGTSGNGRGVYGNSSNGAGVYGTSSGGSGVEGHATSSIAVFPGVYGVSKNGDGVFAESSTTGGYSALYARGDNKRTTIFFAYNKATGGECVIDPKANLTCTGTITGGSEFTQRRNSSGQRVLTYASESATATIENVGTARMINGLANVRIDPAFASLMDRKWYYTFLTPLGDTRGLYVSMKTPTAFQVREVEHGRSSLAFDYRIVAHPVDADNDRR